MNESEKQKGDPAARRQKRPYSKPRLEVYGELGQITGSVGNKSTVGDGGVMSKFTKTR